MSEETDETRSQPVKHHIKEERPSEEDWSGRDPTKNVRDLTDAANQRQDDLRLAQQALTDAKLLHLREIVQLRAEHSRDLRFAEAQRLDSIRQVDREDVSKAGQAAQTAIATLAATTTATAETLRTQVAATATALQNTVTLNMAEVNKRLSALELTYSEGKGKQTVVDPQINAMFQEIQKLTNRGEQVKGKEEGFRMTGGLIAGILSGIVALITIVTAVFGAIVFIRSSQPNPDPRLEAMWEQRQQGISNKDLTIPNRSNQQ